MLDPAVDKRVRDEATARGLDPDAAVAEASKRAGAKAAPSDSSTGDAPSSTGRPVADRLLIGFLPFVKVRELRALWLGLDERIPDDDLTCGDYQVKHGGAAAAPTDPGAQ